MEDREFRVSGFDSLQIMQLSNEHWKTAIQPVVFVEKNFAEQAK